MKLVKKEEKIEITVANTVQKFFEKLKKDYKLDNSQTIRLIEKTKKFFEEENSVPILIFDNDKLGALEAIVKYLKENRDLSFKKISILLNRNEKTVWATYFNAKKKLPGKFELERDYLKTCKGKYKKELLWIRAPLSIFRDRKLSVLESVVKFLKEEHDLKYHEIAVLLNRDDRTIWTTYKRGLKKENESG